MRTRMLMSLMLVSGLLGSLLFAGVAAADGGGGTTLLITRLSGEAERPGPGDEDGRGRAVLRVNGETGRICYALKVADIDPAQAAHIHEVEPGTEVGPVVQGLEAPTTGFSSACVVNAEVAQGLIESPTDYYVNVHNEPFPAGAVRGDLP